MCDVSYPIYIILLYFILLEAFQIYIYIYIIYYPILPEIIVASHLFLKYISLFRDSPFLTIQGVSRTHTQELHTLASSSMSSTVEKVLHIGESMYIIRVCMNVYSTWCQIVVVVNFP